MIFPIAIFYTVVFASAFLVLLGISWLIGRLAFGATNRRWVQILAVLFVVWLPFWDVIPGYFIFRHAFNEIGGARTYKTAEVAGYLEGSTDLPQIWPRLLNGPYEYIEMHRTRPGTVYPRQEGSPGYYEYRLALLVDPACSASNAIRPDEVSDSLDRRLAGRCVLTIRRDEPISRYQYEISPWTRYIEWMAFPDVQIFSEKITDRTVNELLAEAYEVRFRSWSGLFGFHYYRDTNDEPIRLYITEVLVPKAAKGGA